MRKTDTEKEERHQAREDSRLERCLPEELPRRPRHDDGRRGCASGPVQQAVVEKIQAFDAFDDETDPWGQHDFVSVEHDGQTFFAKIDYYNRDLSGHSEDATDPEKTCRVMTIMLAEEY